MHIYLSQQVSTDRLPMAQVQTHYVNPHNAKRTLIPYNDTAHGACVRCDHPLGDLLLPCATLCHSPRYTASLATSWGYSKYSCEYRGSEGVRV